MNSHQPVLIWGARGSEGGVEDRVGAGSVPNRRKMKSPRWSGGDFREFWVGLK